MATKNALLSLSSGVQEKYIFQVIKTTKISEKIIRLTLSDGNAYISADIQTSKLTQTISQTQILWAKLSSVKVGICREIRTLEIVEKNYKYILGKPIPLVDYINQGFRSEQSEQNSQEEHEKILVSEKPKYFRQSQDQKTQVISLEENEPQEMALLIHEPFDPYVLVDDLEPKMNNWKMLGRVSWIDHKMIQVKCGAKAGQRVLVLNFFVMDKLAKQIKCSCFDEAANKFQHLLKRNHIYQFSNGKIFQQAQQSTNRRFLNVRFEVFSTITEVQQPFHDIPKHSYSLVPFDKLDNYGDDQELDFGGIVKSITRKEESSSTKLKMTLVLADPVMKKEIDVLLFLEPEEAMGIVQSSLLVMKNIRKVTEGAASTISLKSSFNSYYLTKFEPSEEIIKKFQPFLNKQLEKEQYQSLSKISYQLRNLNEHMQALELCSKEQKIFSKINCYFVKQFGQRKYSYQACKKCSKKVTIINNRSNYCTQCKKIVEIKDQYLLKSQFADSSRQIKLTLVGDFAKSLVKKDQSEFFQMSIDEQTQYLNSIKFTQICLYLRSFKDKNSFNHNVQIIQKPHLDGLLKIQRILAGVKQQQ